MVCRKKCLNRSLNQSCCMIEQSIVTTHRTEGRISKELLYRIVSNLTWNHIYSTVDDHCTLLNPVALKSKNDHNLVIWVLSPVINGQNPFNQNFWAEVRKFLGVAWIATGSNGLIPFHSQNESRAHLK